MSITGYARVSTADQDPASQIEALRTAGCDPIYIEHASGATMERTQWSECNRGLGRGDTLVVVRIDRLGRSLAEYERTLISERTRAGLDAARAAGRRIGRPPTLTEEQKASARQLCAQGNSIAATARVLGVSRATIRRAISKI